MAKFTVQFPEKTNNALNELAEKEEATKTAIISRAIGLFKYIHKELNEEKGRRLVITDKEGKLIKEFILTD
ncbi:MAG: hypothetical protein P9X24_15635 [Candidatus Hatepunaea meridiana]|nr:hypothetical protein [Candidatus Hatepunaea meridiana]